MNRRSFLRSVGIGTAALYLRFAPNLARAVPQVPKEKEVAETVVDDVWEFPVHARWSRGIGRLTFRKDQKATYEEFLDRPYVEVFDNDLS